MSSDPSNDAKIESLGDFEEVVDEKTGLPEEIARGLAELGLGPSTVSDSDDDDDDDGETLAGAPFANEQNKALNLKVNALERTLSSYEDKLEDNTTRVGIMTDHLKNVEQELLHTQSLVDTKMKEIETEKHLRRMAQLEISRMEATQKSAEKNILNLEGNINVLQAEQFQSHEKLEKFRMQMNWNQEELLQWSLAAKQKEEDRKAVERYKAMDNKKINSLVLQKERVTRDMVTQRNKFEQEVTETQAVQIELNKTADEYRDAHEGRQGLIAQWNDAVQAMARRDEDIKRTKELVEKQQGELRSWTQKMRKNKIFLEQEEINNSQAQVAIDSSQRSVEKCRDLLRRNKSGLAELEEELSTVRNELLQAHAEVNKAVEEKENFEVLKIEKEKRMKQLEVELEEKRKEMEFFISKTEDISAKSKQIELLHARNEEQLQAKFKELESMKNNLFRQQKELVDVQVKRKNAETEIDSAQKASKMLLSKIHKLDGLSMKQQEMLYGTEFQVQQLERKVDRASGKRSFEETEALNKLIKELREQMELHDKGCVQMMHQVKRLDAEVKSAERQLKESTLQQKILAEKLHNIELESGSFERELKNSRKKQRELTMEHGVLNLEVSKLKEKMDENNNKIFALRSRKMELKLQMNSRREELQLFQDIQKGEVKAAEDARHHVAVDLKERKIKAQRLQQKYESIHAKFQKTGEEEKTQAYYIIQVAQEREELQDKGDKLNESIKTAEKDIRMLTKTLIKMNKRNDKYKSMLYKADVNGAEYDLKEKLEEQHRSVSDALYTKKNNLKDIQQENEEKKHALSQALNEIAAMEIDIKDMKEDNKNITKQLMQQESIQQRVSLELSDIDQQLSDTFKQKKKGVREYIQYLHLKQKNRLLLEIFAKLGEDVPQFKDDGLQHVLAETLSNIGVPLPSRPISRASRPSSSRPSSSRPSSSQQDYRSRWREGSKGEGKSILPTVKVGNDSGRLSSRGKVGAGFRGSVKRTGSRSGSRSGY